MFALDVIVAVIFFLFRRTVGFGGLHFDFELFMNCNMLSDLITHCRYSRLRVIELAFDAVVMSLHRVQSSLCITEFALNCFVAVIACRDCLSDCRTRGRYWRYRDYHRLLCSARFAADPLKRVWKGDFLFGRRLECCFHGRVSIARSIIGRVILSPICAFTLAFIVRMTAFM